jgi:hypothetical protein
MMRGSFLSLPPPERAAPLAPDWQSPPPHGAPDTANIETRLSFQLMTGIPT